MTGDHDKTSAEKPDFEPNMATMDAWEAQAHMLAYRQAPQGSAKSDMEKRMATEAFQCVMQHTYDALLSSALQRTGGNVHDAEDILQETYVRAYKHLPGFRGDSQVETWLHSIMFNQLSSFYKRESKHSSVRASGLNEGAAFDSLIDRLPATDTPDVIAQLHGAEIMKHLTEAIDELSPTLGMVAILHFIRGRTHSEIGEELGIDPNTAKLRAHRAKLKLRELPVLRKLFEQHLGQDEIE